MVVKSNSFFFQVNEGQFWNNLHQVKENLIRQLMISVDKNLEIRHEQY